MGNTAHRSTTVTHPALLSRLICLASCLVLGSACASPPPPWLSPVNQTPSSHVSTGKFVWSDLLTQDVDAAKAFYGGLFGWTFNDTGRYTQILREGVPIGGIVKARDPKRHSEWIGNLSVADVDRAAEQARAQGGKVLTEPVDAPSRGRIAVVADPEGSLVLLLRSSAGDPADADAPLNGWLWWELWSQDTDSALRFYSSIAGYETETTVFREQSYHVLRRDDVPRAGVLEAPPEVPPQWLPYVRVADAESLADRATTLGGRIIIADARSAIIEDPTGANIVIQVWSKNDRLEEEPAR